MRSPVDATSKLKREQIGDGLTVMRCEKTGGVWVRPAAYWKWREAHLASPGEASRAEAGEDVPAADSPAGKRCPEDGAFLIRHRVGHGLNFHIDRCGHCGGIWLDSGEWRALADHRLHDKLHMMFSSTWQAEVIAQDQREAHERRMADMLGDAACERIRDFAAWMNQYPQRSVAHAYLRQQLRGEDVGD